MEESGSLGVSTSVGDISFIAAQNTMDDLAAFGDSILNLLDETSIVFKGVIDQSGNFFVDSSQFVNLLLDQSQLPQSIGLEIGDAMPNDMPNLSLTTSHPSAGKFILTQQANEFNKISKPLQPFQLPTQEILQLNRDFLPDPQLCHKGNEQTDVFSMKPVQKDLYAQPKRISYPAKHITPAHEKIIQPLDTSKTCHVCDICQKSFRTYLHMRKHRAGHLSEKPYRCQECIMEFNFEINLKLHSFLHEAEKTGNLQCQQCQAKFSRLVSLKSHLRVHEEEENLVCNECGEEVPTLIKLNEHMEEHKIRISQCMVYRCKLCGKTLMSQGLLRDHAKEHAAVRHELKVFARQKARPKGKRDSICVSNSGWSTSSMDSKQSKKRVCSVCGKGFDKPSQLQRHFRIHSGEKPFKCTYEDCDKCFNQKVTLESHVLACHKLLKPHKCHLCNVSFSQRGNLKSHIVKVHIPSAEAEQIFKCQECGCLYRRLATLNNHIARVHTINTTTGDQTVDNQPNTSSLPTEPIATEASTSHNLSSECIIPSETCCRIPCHIESVPTEILKTSFTKEVTVPSSNLGEMPSIGVTNSEILNHISATGILPEPPLKEEPIQEVNCVYRDSDGTSKRFLVKVKKVGTLKYHLCPVCPKSFRKPSDLIRHIRTHTLERPYMCTICNKAFAVKSTLNTHIKVHDPIKQLSCGVCQKKFSVLSSLKSHERLHTGAKPFQCKQCGKYFRTSSQRRVHLKVHTRNALGITGKRKLLRIGETMVQEKLADPLKLTVEGLVPVSFRKTNDQKNRPFSCSHEGCGASFTRASHLKEHFYSHTGERPYKCLQCLRCFITNRILKNHIKTHEGIRPYTCTICNSSFTTNGSLKRHIGNKHKNERPFICPYCAKTFKTSASARRHIKIHQDEIVPLNGPITCMDQEQSRILLLEQNQPRLPDVSLHLQSSENQHEQLVGFYDDTFSEPYDLGEAVIRCKPPEGPSFPPVPVNQIIGGGPITCHEASEVIHNPDGTITLQYGTSYPMLPTQSIPTGSSDLRLGDNFDPSLFTLQGESLDLQFLQDAPDITTISKSCLSDITPFNFQQSDESLQIQNQSTDHATHRNSFASASSKATEISSRNSEPVLSKIKTRESNPCIIENSELMKSGAPISEQLYSELKSQPFQYRTSKRFLASTSVKGGDENFSKLNECAICQSRFKKKSDLERHLRIHTGEKPYRCAVCGKSFRVKSTSKAHMRTHEEKKQTVSCHVCHNSFSTKSSLRVHLRLHLDLKPYDCPYPNCTRNFRTSGHRKSHIKSHFKNSKELAAVTAATMAAVRKEAKQDTIQRPSQPAQTLTSVQTITDLHNTQPSLHRGVNPLNSLKKTTTQDNMHHILSSVGVQLQLDGFTNLDLSSLQVDETFLQNVIFIPTSQAGTEEIVQCNDTSNVVIGMLPIQDFGAGGDLLTGKDVTLSLLTAATGFTSTGESMSSSAHLALNDGNIQHYVITNDLMRSNTVQTEELPTPTNSMTDYICQICLIPFGTKQLLDKHEKSHNPQGFGIGMIEKPFKCSLCSRSFTQKSSLDSHLQSHSRQKKEFSCPLCPFSTQRKQNLKIHFTRAHPNNLTQFNEAIELLSSPTVRIPVSS